MYVRVVFRAMMLIALATAASTRWELQSQKRNPEAREQLWCVMGGIYLLLSLRGDFFSMCATRWCTTWDFLPPQEFSCAQRMR